MTAVQALVDTASETRMTSLNQQYTSALEQREAHHIALLEELKSLRRLQSEASGSSCCGSEEGLEKQPGGAAAAAAAAGGKGEGRGLGQQPVKAAAAGSASTGGKSGGEGVMRRSVSQEAVAGPVEIQPGFCDSEASTCSNGSISSGRQRLRAGTIACLSPVQETASSGRDGARDGEQDEECGEWEEEGFVRSSGFRPNTSGTLGGGEGGLQSGTGGHGAGGYGSGKYTRNCGGTGSDGIDYQQQELAERGRTSGAEGRTSSNGGGGITLLKSAAAEAAGEGTGAGVAGAEASAMSQLIQAVLGSGSIAEKQHTQRMKQRQQHQQQQEQLRSSADYLHGPNSNVHDSQQQQQQGVSRSPVNEQQQWHRQHQQQQQQGLPSGGSQQQHHHHKQQQQHVSWSGESSRMGDYGHLEDQAYEEQLKLLDEVLGLKHGEGGSHVGGTGLGFSSSRSIRQAGEYQQGQGSIRNSRMASKPVEQQQQADGDAVGTRRAGSIVWGDVFAFPPANGKVVTGESLPSRPVGGMADKGKAASQQMRSSQQHQRQAQQQQQPSPRRRDTSPSTRPGTRGRGAGFSSPRGAGLGLKSSGEAAGYRGGVQSPGRDPEVEVFGQRLSAVRSSAAAAAAGGDMAESEAVAAASSDATALLSGSCLRCGLTDMSSPGDCCFHPALLPNPGPLLYSPEWHMCKAAGHTLDMPGCHHRMQHYYMYPVGVLGAASISGAPAAAAGLGGGASSGRRGDGSPGGGGGGAGGGVAGEGWSKQQQQQKVRPLVQPKWHTGVVRQEAGTMPQPRTRLPSPSPQRR